MKLWEGGRLQAQEKDRTLILNFRGRWIVPPVLDLLDLLPGEQIINRKGASTMNRHLQLLFPMALLAWNTRTV